MKTFRIKSVFSMWIAALLICSLPEMLTGQILKWPGAKYLQFSGQTMLYGELYGMDGAERRRPPSTGRMAFTPQLSIGKVMTISADMILSTEGSEMRQNMNILGLHPAWAWGRGHLGDYSDQFGLLTLNGVNIKGGELDLFPRKFRLTLGGGQTRRAVEGYELEQSYAQYLYAGRIGYGDPKKRYLDLQVIKVKDDIESLPRTGQGWDYTVFNPDTLQVDEDSLWIDKSFAQIRNTPQENLVVGTVAHLALPHDSRLSIEAAAAAYTKDLYADPIPADSVDVPPFARNLMDYFFTPRHSSFGDYALNSSLELGLFNAKTQIEYRYIGPGYISLGTPSNLNDRQEIHFGTAFKWRVHRIQFKVMRFSDNLLGQKENTNFRNQFRTGINSMIGHWRSNIQVNGLLLNNDASADSLAYDFNTWILSTHQAYTFARESWMRQLGVQYTFQESNKDKWLQTTQASYHTVTLTGQIQLIKQVDANLSAGLSHRNSESGEKYTTRVYSARLTHRALTNRLMTALFSSSSLIRDTRMIRTGVTASYRLTGSAQIHATLSSNIFRGSRNYQEIIGNLRLSHQFKAR
ncbi:hypothetical protein JW992_16535 [candidate division KSB1 bacterium]|nr:hypothetical protein [candidate division KSB1 bacterium]